MEDTEQEIRERVEQGGEPSEAVAEGNTPDANDDGDSALSALPVPSLSKRQLALLGAVVLAVIIVHQMRSRSGSSTTNRGEAREAIEDIDDTEEVVDEESGEAIELPADPDEVLDLDDAVLEALFRDEGED